MIFVIVVDMIGMTTLGIMMMTLGIMMKKIKCPVCQGKIALPAPKFKMIPSDDRVWTVEETYYCSHCETYVPERNLLNE
jgi:C4-type Zn-finger protein